MASVFLLRLNKIDEPRTRWADYNDDCLECYFLNQKTEMYHFQEKRLLNCKLCENISLQLIRSEKIMTYQMILCKNFNFRILIPLLKFPVNLRCSSGVFSLFSVISLCLGVLRFIFLICLLEGKILKRWGFVVVVSFSLKECFLLPWKWSWFSQLWTYEIMGKSSVALACGQNRSRPWRESSEFMAGSTCSVCQYLWCHKQTKTTHCYLHNCRA